MPRRTFLSCSLTLHGPRPQVAEAALTDVRVEGSLLVHADCVLGAMEAVPTGALPVTKPLPRAPRTSELHMHHLNGRTQVTWWQGAELVVTVCR